MRNSIAVGLLCLAAVTSAWGQDKMISGPQVGQAIPGSFNFFHVNPPPPKDKPDLEKGIARFRCPVLEFEHKPVVMIFAREPGKDQEEVFDGFLKKLDEVVHKHWTNDFAPLRGIVIFLSKDGKSSVSEKAVEDPFLIVKEAELRTALKTRIEKRAENMKRLGLGFTIPEGPATYKIHSQAQMTVLFYNNLKVLENVVFGPQNPLTEEAGEKFLAKVDGWAEKAEKK